MPRRTHEDIVTVRCFQCRKWLVRADSIPAGVRCEMPPVSGRIDGKCYCEPCLRGDFDPLTKSDDRD